MLTIGTTVVIHVDASATKAKYMKTAKVKGMSVTQVTELGFDVYSSFYQLPVTLISYVSLDLIVAFCRI